MTLPISVVIPTRNRAQVLLKTLETFVTQTSKVAEIVIVDGSDDDRSLDAVNALRTDFEGCFVYQRANAMGAAIQRNQGIAASSQPFVLFADDDVYLDVDCVTKLWIGINLADDVGGVSSMIKNEKYERPGGPSWLMYRILSGEKRASYAGRLIGPGWNLLPEDSDGLPEYVECQWLNTGCTIYRKQALPEPAFASHFHGYSLMEDVALSYSVSKKWKLLNARTARIYHDSQGGSHKSRVSEISKMELINRHYIMRRVMGKSRASDYLKLFLFEVFQLASLIFVQRNPPAFFQSLWGKIRALTDIR